MSCLLLLQSVISLSIQSILALSRQPVQSGRKLVQVASAIVGDNHHVLHADPPDGAAVKPRFDGQSVARHQGRAAEVQQRRFMDIECGSVLTALQPTALMSPVDRHQPGPGDRVNNPVWRA